MDGDGVNDTIDSISGNESFITTNIEDIKLKVGSYESVDNKTVNGTNTVKLTVGSYDIVEFEFNFTNSTLDTKNITIKKQENDTKGSIIITGIDLTTQGKTKTVYLDHLNSSSNSVCIKDAEVLSIAR
jgi:sucrose-6-phosphate hydrolase SacC (GH32 family)